MKKLSANEFHEIRRWMYRNARPVDLAIWQYHFEGGSKDAVLLALSAYQNSDGGFGLALEADSWNPNSSPYTTGTAIEILKEIGFSDLHHPLVQGILAYLDSGAYFSEKGWPFTIPTNSDYPHAPWWTYNEDTNTEYGFFCTSVLVGFLLRYADKASGLYAKALAISDSMVGTILKSEQVDVHDLQGYCGFLGALRQTGLDDRYDCALFESKLIKFVYNSIERDPAKWPSYSMRPSMYIDSPGSLFYAGNEDVVENELEYILNSRKAQGVWDISWSWAEYPAEFAVSANWWKALWATRNLMLLKAFDRIEA